MLVGAGIALAIKQPLVAVPLAFLSHFALDVVPHFGIAGDDGFEGMLRLPHAKAMLYFTLISTAILAFTPGLWDPLTAACALAAVSPDFHWMARYMIWERNDKQPPKSRFAHWHSWIQWGERPWGLYVEIVFFVIGYGLLLSYLN